MALDFAVALPGTETVGATPADAGAAPPVETGASPANQGLLEKLKVAKVEVVLPANRKPHQQFWPEYPILVVPQLW